MAYDEALASRVRAMIGPVPGVAEMKMFGGLAFLVHGNMAIAASGRGGMLVRVDPAESEQIIAGSKARPAEMRGRLMAGWLRVDVEALGSDAELSEWVERGLAFARSLPSKR
jgi:TfoX/Sxy family transcriptional regulator of competence genes